MARQMDPFVAENVTTKFPSEPEIYVWPLVSIDSRVDEGLGTTEYISGHGEAGQQIMASVFLSYS